MGKLTGAFAVGCLFALMASPVWAGPDEDLIRKVITDQARAMTDFPRSKDMQAVLKFYARDYAGIDNGRWQDLKDAEKFLADLEEQINLGNPVGISTRVSNIKVQISGAMAWATYDQEVKVGALGQVVGQELQKCTGIYKKKGTEWLIQHGHCSTLRQEYDEEEGGQE